MTTMGGVPELAAGRPPGSRAGTSRSRPLVGRDRELAEVAEAIRSSPVSTLTGPGGVGKTALALAVAASSSAQFPDGVFVVWLASLRSADLVAGEIAAQVGMPRSGGQSNEDALAGWLADRDVLLVLDNCEHVVSAVAELVDNLTARLPRLRILATSREPLWVVDEITTRLSPLPAADAVRLFQERAGARTAGSLAGGRAAALVDEICRRVDGLPLAIELTAARVVGLDLEDISHHLDDLFDLLPQVAWRADGAPRSLRATVEWSDALLTEDERRLLRRMAVFAGSFDLAAINHVGACEGCSPAKMADLTARLVEKSLVTRAPDAGAYRMLETIRQYAAEQLALSGELDATRDRHARYYCDIARRAAGTTLTPPEAEHLDLLRRIEDNVRVALERLLVIDPVSALDLAASLNLFWWTQGRMREGLTWLQRARRAAPAPPAELLAMCFFCEAFLVSCDADDWRTAADLVDAGIDALADADERPLVLAMLHGLRSQCYAVQGDAESALERAETGYRLASRYAGSWGQCYCMWHLGITRRAIGDEDGAIAVLDECCELTSARGYAIGEMIVCNDLGAIWKGRDDLGRARTLLERSLQIRRELGAIRIGAVHGTMAASIFALARVVERQGDTATAAQLLKEALVFAEDMRETRRASEIADLLRKIGTVESARRAMLRPDRGTWQVQYDGTDLHMPDLKGLWHLRELLARPHQPVSALALLGATSNEPLPAADAGPVLDREALRQYRKRLAELDHGIDVAVLRADRKTEGALCTERQALIDELKRATGLGGRPRRSGSPSEKARLNVTRTIRHAIAELAAEAPALAAHLDESITTGVSCCYAPKVDVAWST